MNLSRYPVGAGVAVSPMDRAREFHEEKLGLSGGQTSPDGGHTNPCASGTAIHVYPSPDNAGKSAATLAGWEVDDLDAVVDELTSKGVAFEHYDQPPVVTMSGASPRSRMAGSPTSNTPTATCSRSGPKPRGGGWDRP